MLYTAMASFPIFLVLAGFVLWLITLVYHIRRTDLSDSDRIVWTVVLCTLNILGVILYWVMAPAGESRVRTEKELKEHFNSRSR
jgi:membrane protein implicated in regulation of membrane protease activity